MIPDYRDGWTVGRSDLVSVTTGTATSTQVLTPTSNTTITSSVPSLFINGGQLITGTIAWE